MIEEDADIDDNVRIILNSGHPILEFTPEEYNERQL